MVIYAEYLFIENFLIGAAILKISAWLGKLETGKIRIFIGSICCGLFAFVIFLDNLGMAAGMLVKIVFSLALSRLVFGKSFVKGTVIIYLTSVFMGGMTIALLYLTRIKGMSNNAVVYIGDVSYMNVIFGIAISGAILLLFAHIMHEKQLREKIFTDVVLKVENHSVVQRALIDSGNFLRDPFLGRPVAVISRPEGGRLKGIKEIEWEKRFCPVPYSGIGVEKGLMEGYRVDELVINGRSLKNVVVAIFDSDFYSFCREERYEMLLSEEMLAGGSAE